MFKKIALFLFCFQTCLCAIEFDEEDLIECEFCKSKFILYTEITYPVPKCPLECKTCTMVCFFECIFCGSSSPKKLFDYPFLDEKCRKKECLDKWSDYRKNSGVDK